MKSNKALINILSSIVLQAAIAISGLILPHFFISFYGSAINGMISSITQFLSYLALVEAGISAAAIVELYSPLENKDEKGRNYVLSATKKFYFQSGMIYVVLLLILLVVYPEIIRDQVDRLTTILMISILAGSNLIDYFLLGKYRVLLSADQKVYILNYIQSIGTILNVVVSIVLMYQNMDVVIVKLVATAIYAFRALVVIIYVRKHYNNIKFNCATEKNALPQRWSALFHQVVGVICNNTDIILITLCLGSQSLIEASVYYVYNLAASMFTSIANSLSTAITPSFGKLYVSKRNDELRSLYSDFEFFYFIFIVALYACMFILILPFVNIYTLNVNDADYFRPNLAILFVIMGLIQNIRIPSLSMICAAGHYKQTQWRAFAEAVINLSVSVVLIFKLGIAGAVIGTICSYAYRTLDSIIYSRRFFSEKVFVTSILRVIRNLIVGVVLCLIVQHFGLAIESWKDFIINGIILFPSFMIVLIIVNYVFEFGYLRRHFRLLRRLIDKKRSV